MYRKYAIEFYGFLFATYSCKEKKIVKKEHPIEKNDSIKVAEKEIPSKKIKVVTVNTISIAGKKRRVRGFTGRAAGYKKAIMTLLPGQTIDEQV